MKQKYKLVVSAATASFLTCAALAQEASNPNAEATNTAALQRMGPERVELMKSTAKTREVIGMTVENLQHVQLGQVSDFALDLKSGRIVQVILASGELLTAVPPGALHPDPNFKTLQLDASREKFNAAPRFNPAKWEEETQSNRVSAADLYFGEQPYFATITAGNETTNQNGTINALGTRDRYRGYRVKKNKPSSPGSRLIAEALAQIKVEFGGGPMPYVWAAVKEGNRPSVELFRRHNFIRPPLQYPGGTMIRQGEAGGIQVVFT